MSKITDFFASKNSENLDIRTVDSSNIMEISHDQDDDIQDINISSMHTVDSENNNDFSDQCQNSPNISMEAQDTGNLEQNASKSKRNFVKNWLSSYPWLIKISASEVKCSVCEMNRSDKKNDWASGKVITQWHKATFTKHCQSKKHRENLLIAPQQKSLKSSTKLANSKAEAQTTGLMMNILAAIQMEMSINKIDALHNLSDLHIERALEKNSDVDHVAIKLSRKHRSLFSTYKLINALNAMVTKDEIHKFRNCLALCLHVDESTDFNSNKYLLLYLTIVAADCPSAEEHYAVILPLESSCDAETIALNISSWLEKIGIQKRQLVMFTSDGASVMLGRRQGVAERLRSDYGYTHLLDFHCICHRENLALKDAYEASDAFKRLETLIRETINFLSTYKNLTQLKAIADSLEEALYMPRRIIEIRWLSRFQVIRNFVNSIEIILAFLEEKSRDDIIAETLLSHLSQSQNLFLLHHLHDLLGPLESLMTHLQKKNLHPFDALTLVKATIDQIKAKSMCTPIAGPMFISLIDKINQKKIRISEDGLSAQIRTEAENHIRELAANIASNLKDRLWNNNKVLRYFQIFEGKNINVLDKKSLLLYGHKELSDLTDFYKSVFNLDSSRIKQEWDMFKFTHLKSSSQSHDNWKDAVKRCVIEHEIFPNLSQLAAALLCFNAQNATVERGFSTLNRIKTKLRNRLSVPVIDMLLRLRLSTVPYAEFNFASAFHHYTKGRVYCLGIKQSRRQSLNDISNETGINFGCFTDLVGNNL